MQRFCIFFLISFLFVSISFARGSAQADSLPQTDADVKQLSRELRSYIDAELALLRDEQALELENQECMADLANLDAAHTSSWRTQMSKSRAIYRKRARYMSDLQSLEKKATQLRDPKTLRYLIEHKSDGARARYRKQREMADQNYRLNQSLKEQVELSRNDALFRLGERSV